MVARASSHRGDLILANDLEDWLIACFTRALSHNKSNIPGCHIIPSADELAAMQCVIESMKAGFTFDEIKDALNDAGVKEPPTEAELKAEAVADWTRIMDGKDAGDATCVATMARLAACIGEYHGTDNTDNTP